MGRASRFAVPLGVVMIVVMMVVPVPTFVLDLLIAVNITAALVVVLVSMYVRKALEFSSFPSLLLVATLFRLALNISATRSVLENGYAGKVIEAFGHFVVGGSLIIGLVIFVILLVIQFVVITNGAARVAEVGARFTLDAMPGKQMAIDADLNSGTIDEAEARRRRREISAEADFYGSMDGSTRFVKGDAIAAIIITIVNLVGGIAIGVLSRGMDVTTALNSYALMSVGDGLVSQIPALLLSVSTGLIVTRSADEDDLGSVVAKQIGGQRRALRIAGSAALVLCLVPGMPKLPFIAIGVSLLVMASRTKPTTDAGDTPTAQASAPDPDSTESLLTDATIDPLELVLAADLVSLANAPGADLIDRVKSLRRSLVRQLGIVMPAVRTRDDVMLPSATYAVRVNGVEVARGQAPPGTVLAIGDGLEGLPGRVGREPVFGVEGKWIPAELQSQAQLLGATVVDRSSVVITHLSEVVKTYASRLLGREDTAAMVAAVRLTHPTVVEDVTPAVLTLADIQRVLHGLLDEQVTIRDLVRILEALPAAAKGGADPDRLIEAARLAVAPAIVDRYARDGRLAVLTIDARIQQSMLESLRPSDNGAQLLLPPGLGEHVVDRVQDLYRTTTEAGRSPVLVCAPPIRRPLHNLVAMAIPDLAVLSFSEVTAGNALIESLGDVTDVRDPFV